ncbi:hemerythrin family protein [uncultured Propionivibrio sp.]|uniref:bacteriohemerythrin n=1 Tax=uncultured Propionivibrio sp. TaxID=426737 RepID=UPI0029C08D48|nr:hemerythrin family protein [uncultured Propionivibrio sp.]
MWTGVELPLNTENAGSLSTLMALRTGNKRIDDKRADLFVALEKLQKAVQSEGVQSAEFSEIFSRIGLDLARYIRNEESLFIDSDMPVDDIFKHIRAHARIMEEFTQLNMDLMQGNFIDGITVINQARQWILNHVISYDLKLRPFIADKQEP